MESTHNPKILLVEGRDDEKVIEYLLKSKTLNYPFRIENKNGFHNLRQSLPNHIKTSEVKVVGIVADANDNLNDRWKSISNQIAKAECEVPSKPEPDGTIFSDWKGTRIGVWIMPNNKCNGELEDFIRDMIFEDDPVLPLAKGYIDNIPEKNCKFSSKKRVRAYVHAWLATCEEPRPMGLAILTGDLNKDAGGANQFIDWLRELFQF
ncbi:MAG: hypothetical protein OXC63_07370 [Aestuariivita sp.]|nr:hypothetical protein [Aestuariivita sp.]MCY4345707.1 hypothetical protein [Aestuariivita sp.]